MCIFRQSVNITVTPAIVILPSNKHYKTLMKFVDSLVKSRTATDNFLAYSSL